MNFKRLNLSVTPNKPLERSVTGFSVRGASPLNAELDHRLDVYRKDATVGSPWPDVMARILERA